MTGRIEYSTKGLVAVDAKEVIAERRSGEILKRASFDFGLSNWSLMSQERGGTLRTGMCRGGQGIFFGDKGSRNNFC